MADFKPRAQVIREALEVKLKTEMKGVTLATVTDAQLARFSDMINIINYFRNTDDDF